MASVASSPATPSKIYNPFIAGQKLNFPSFTDAFGEVALKKEAEHLKKYRPGETAEESKLDPDKQQKTKTNTNTNTNTNNKIKQTNLNTSSTSTAISSLSSAPSQHASYGGEATPVPHQTSSFSITSLVNKLNNHSKKQSLNQQNKSLPIQTITSDTASRQSSHHLSSLSHTNSDELIVTPVPTKKKPKIKKQHQQIDKKQTMSISITSIHNSNTNSNNSSGSNWNLCITPNPNRKRQELCSPAPNDHNARLLTKTPAKFPIVLPGTPCTPLHVKQRQEAQNEEYFKKHVPLLTPETMRKKGPPKLYDPTKDVNATRLLKSSDAPFSDPEDNDDIFHHAKPGAISDLDMSSIANISSISNKNNDKTRSNSLKSDSSFAFNPGKISIFSNNSDIKDNKDKKNNKQRSDSPSPIFDGKSAAHSLFGSRNNSSKSQGSDISDLSFAMHMDKDDRSEVDDRRKFKATSPLFVPITPTEDINDNHRKHQHHETPMEKSKSVSLESLDAQFSSIKLNKTQKKTKSLDAYTPEKQDVDMMDIKESKMEDDDEEDELDEDDNGDNEESENELLMDVSPLSDVEFFQIKSEQSTQTIPVVIFNEEDIPKIRYNDRMLSDIYYDKTRLSNNISLSRFSSLRDMEVQDDLQNDIQNLSTQSDKILYSNPLKHNRDSIEYIDNDISTLLYSDDNNDNIENIENMNDINFQKPLKFPDLINKNRKKRNKTKRYRKKSQNSQAKFKQYKLSNLAQNPNFTICNAHDQSGNLI